VTIDDRVARTVRDLFGLGHITLTDETTPDEIPGWDSLGNINLMYALEMEFGLQFDDADYSPIRSIGELKERLRRHDVT
jgi:acyl carrier protein